MKVIQSLDSTELPDARTALTIGNFDGVHRGHQEIFAVARACAARAGGPCVAVTFDPHPTVVLRPDRAPAFITDRQRKIELLGDAGADYVVVLESTPALLGLEAEAFVDLLMDRLHPTDIVEGASFRFGRGRAGTPDLLRRLAGAKGFTAHVVDLVRVELPGGQSIQVSSTAIRDLLIDGRVEDAAACLGRPFRLTGRIVTGEGRGAELGFPTVNLDTGGQVVPGDGVYAGAARLPDIEKHTDGANRGMTIHRAAISIGTTPTFDQKQNLQRRVEAHILDFDIDAYGRRVELDFVARLRDQKRFDSINLLTDQIRRDVDAVRRMDMQRAASAIDAKACT